MKIQSMLTMPTVALALLLIGVGQAGADQTVTGNLFVPGGKVGVGSSSTPFLSYHVRQAGAPGFRLQPTGGTYSYMDATCSTNGGTNWGIFSVYGETGQTQIDFDILANDHTSPALFRMFRNTNTTGNKVIYIYKGNGTAALSSQIGLGALPTYFATESGSKFGIGTSNPATKLHVNGETTTNVINITGGSDLSERFDISPARADQPVQPGMVVCIDPAKPGDLIVSQKPYDATVAGVISGAGGLNPGMLMSQVDSEAHGKYPVALTGRVYVFCDATQGAIRPGDMLTTSETPGHAMKVREFDRAHGAAIGKAMSNLDEGRGLVLVLVNLQ